MLRGYVAPNGGTDASLVVPHSGELLSSRDPLFWCSCFLRLFPRGDCAERCRDRLTHLPSWRWAKCLLTRGDFGLWRLDVEFVASLYNIFLRRDQISAVEACVRSNQLTRGEQCELESLTATGLVAHALSSGDVNSVRDALRRKNLDVPIRNALRQMQIVQRNVRGSESEKDNLMSKFTAIRIWSG